MEVLYHIRPYFVGIFPWNGHWIYWRAFVFSKKHAGNKKTSTSCSPVALWSCYSLCWWWSWCEWPWSHRPRMYVSCFGCQCVLEHPEQTLPKYRPFKSNLKILNRKCDKQNHWNWRFLEKLRGPVVLNVVSRTLIFPVAFLSAQPSGQPAVFCQVAVVTVLLVIDVVSGRRCAAGNPWCGHMVTWGSPILRTPPIAWHKHIETLWSIG